MIEILPLIVLFVIYPVIVKMNIFPTPRGSLEYLAHPLGDANGDFYFYEKLEFLIPLAALSLLIFLLKKEGEWVEKKNYWQGYCKDQRTSRGMN